MGLVLCNVFNYLLMQVIVTDALILPECCIIGLS